VLSNHQHPELTAALAVGAGIGPPLSLSRRSSPNDNDITAQIRRRVFDRPVGSGRAETARSGILPCLARCGPRNFTERGLRWRRLEIPDFTQARSISVRVYRGLDERDSARGTTPDWRVRDYSLRAQSDATTHGSRGS